MPTLNLFTNIPVDAVAKIMGKPESRQMQFLLLPRTKKLAITMLPENCSNTGKPLAVCAR
ncbi:unnamed protein product [Brassica oleracea var. botrytis]